jgi:peptidoglycan/LPS O-acetylase OafA/YrhL
MFIYTNVQQGGGWITALYDGILSMTLTQAWFPMHAEVWNAPTWYLSSLTFSTAMFPFALPKLATMNKKSLRRTAVWLFLLKLLPVLGYCYDHNAFGIVEGLTVPKAHPAYAVFNTQRFHPVFNTAEILLGAVACRLAMLDSADNDKDNKMGAPKTNWLSTTLPFVGLLSILTIRAANLVPDVSDLLVRSAIFTPLFLNFVMACHRNAVSNVPNDIVSNFLSSKPLVWLGGLSFPIYIVHGPLGQVFYKRLIAGKLWGGVLQGPKFFGMYMVTVFASAYLLQQLYLNNKAVGAWSQQKVQQFASWM